MTLSKWIISKGLWYGLAVASALAIAQFFDLVPQSIKDFFKWFNDSTAALLFTLCFLVACFVFVKVTNRKKQGATE